MAGEIHRLIERIIELRCGGNMSLVMSTKTKMLLKGLDPDKYTETSPDDPAIIARVRELADHLGVML
jgi:hypothetical protein